MLELLEALNRAGAGERLSQPEFAPERMGRCDTAVWIRSARSLSWVGAAEVQLGDGLERILSGRQR